MERLHKELQAEKQKLELLKAEVNDMEYDALQRRFRRVNSSSFIPNVSARTRAHTPSESAPVLFRFYFISPASIALKTLTAVESRLKQGILIAPSLKVR